MARQHLERRGAHVGLAVALAAALHAGCCRVPPPDAGPRTTPVLPGLLERIERGSAEDRYHATLRLRCHGGEGVRARLRALLDAEEPLTRNAAARALVELGEEDAAAVLIANLDRRHRTWAVTDAIHHLRELFGTDRGYDPNLGYRHQVERQEAWWRWWTARGHDRPGDDGFPEDAEAAARFTDLQPRVQAYAESAAEPKSGTWAATADLWKRLGELAPSREPAHVALVARAFGAMARRWPDQPNLWNNWALASLNDGWYANAEVGYRRALALSPDDAYFHNDYGILLEGLGRLEEAEAQYREAIRLDPKDATWRHNLGDVLAQRGCVSQAIAAYREAERLDPEIWHYHRLPIRRLSAR